ncbi:GspE/PulE family protein [Candidatus Stoquefichus massiliensis]|uniref:GspE/PulE family protein n=1 Tax=Candidatus Stoquefichus massiliensis TaxID=1470350 RepID=UPI00047F7454|nr:GspE/PulE family protein [Candidatus Stoquefichus massiliensis]
MKRVPIGEVLKEYGYITEEQLQEALDVQKKDKSKRLGQHLIDLGFVNEEQTLRALSAKLDYPMIDLSTVSISIDAVSKIPQQLAEKYNVIGIKIDGNTLTVVSSDPMDFYALEDIRLVTGMNISIGLAVHDAIENAIDYNYSEIKAKSAAEIANRDTTQFEAIDEEIFDSESDDSPIVKLLNSLLTKGFSSNASDIHIEPFEKETLVRMRIDGMLIESMKLQKSIHSPLVVRTKILANLDISERRIPQDGHFVVTINGERMNLRVSIVPTVYGEKIVMRFLNSNTPIDYANHFGMTDINFTKMNQMMENPNGIIYVTGPTGSGKTTTLYMIMEKLARRNVNILTIEDPVEKNLERINQMQVNNIAGLTFESGLRAILRQDPDIIMVGETRDAETASISVRAAITGHLVVSTLHTNDAVSTIVRLIDMGIEPYMVANSVVGIVAQRLVKKVCPHCANKVEATDEDKRIAGKNLPYVYRSVGCPACHNTGYKGRIAVHEMVLIDKKIKKMITDRADIDDIYEYVKLNQEYSSLFQETLRLVEEGKTTIEELLKISYYER